MKIEDLIKKAVVEFSKKENHICSCKIHDYPITSVDIAFENCGTLAFTVCWYASQNRITIENLVDFPICRKAIKMIFAEINKEFAEISKDCERSTK